MKAAFLILITLFSSCFQNPKTKPKPKKLIITNERQDEVFNRILNPITDKYELPKLRDVSLSGNDLEVRVWVTGFDIDGFILSRIDNIWSAIAIKQINCNEVSYYSKNKRYQLGKIHLSEPKLGWENTWRKLFDAGIIDLPNSERIGFIDGVSYIVETNQNDTYRIYNYSNPELHKTEEAMRMIKIGEIIADEFGLGNFKIGNLCLEK
jgi:hypothetical protein